MYTKRFYRDWMNKPGFVRFEIRRDYSDLLILCDVDLKRKAQDELDGIYRELDGYIRKDPEFVMGLDPRRLGSDAPSIARHMASVAADWSVGPMAAVAGAVAQRIGESLLRQCGNVMVENGGDVYVKSDEPVRFALYAGEASPFSNKIHFSVKTAEGLGVCTSSSTVGPSLSFGNADAVVAIAPDAALADAAATALCNRIKTPADIDPVIAMARRRGLLQGVIACTGNRIGFWGDFELEC